MLKPSAMNPRSASNRARGFTLIELTVTMVIFGILVIVTVPSMRLWVANAKVRAVADALQNGLRLAQSESLRRSRQVVFSLTDSTTPQNGGFTAAANGSNWSINTIPSMTDGNEIPAFVESGALGTSNAGVTVTGPAAVCFNSVGRLVANGATGITGATCTLPTGTPPVQSYGVNFTGADRPLQVNLGLGGQVHMCDPAKTLSTTNPDGC